MSIAVLTQVYDEVRRLSIAGSVVAPGDFRLKKLIPPLEQAGQKAPVFAKVAESVTKLVESTEKTSAEALLDVSTLVNAILYTQGETGVEGKLEPIASIDLGQMPTQASARMMKPLLEALTTTGSGRLEIIRDAYDRGAFRDRRLVEPSLKAIDDVYPEIGEFVAEKVLPLYGTAILPNLKESFDLKGRRGNVRRLKLMAHLDPEGTRNIVKQALEEGSKEVKVAAIECLGASPEDLSFLLEQAKAKAKDVRAAALKALSHSHAKEAVAAISAALQGNDLDIAVPSVQSSTNAAVHEVVLSEADAQLKSLLSGKEKDKAKLSKQAGRMLYLLECLRGRTDKDAEKFLIDALGKREQILQKVGAAGGKDIEERLVMIIANGPPKAQKLLVDQHASISPELFIEAFFTACRTRPAKEVFEMFSPYLTAKPDGKKKREDPATVRSEGLVGTLSTPWLWHHITVIGNVDEARRVVERLDPRWLDLAVTQNILPMVLGLARPDHKRALQVMSQALVEKTKNEKELDLFEDVLQAMVRVGHPEATDAVLASIKRESGTTNHYWMYRIHRMIPHLPKEAIPKLEALVPTLSDKVANQVLDGLTELRMNHQQATI